MEHLKLLRSIIKVDHVVNNSLIHLLSSKVETFIFIKAINLLFPHELLFGFHFDQMFSNHLPNSFCLGVLCLLMDIVDLNCFFFELFLLLFFDLFKSVLNVRHTLFNHLFQIIQLNILFKSENLLLLI